MSQTPDDVTVEWFRSVGAKVWEEDRYELCELQTGTMTCDPDETGEYGAVKLEFIFSEDGVLLEAAVGVPVSHGSDITIPRPVTRDRVRKLASALGLELPEQPT